MVSRLVRIALSLGFAVAVLALPAVQASAIPPTCDPTDPSCDPVVVTVETGTRLLTVTRTTGAVVSSPAGIDCGTDCTQSTPVQRECVDLACDPWPATTSYTLGAAGGPLGYSPVWSACGRVATCTVHLGSADVGTDSASVALTWVDTAAPSLSFNPPTKIRPTAVLTASATDNSGSIARYDWVVDNVLQAATGSSLSLGAFAEGSHAVAVSARDAAGNVSTSPTRTVTLDKHVGVVVGALPAFTNAVTVPLDLTTDADVVSKACKFDGGTSVACDSGWSGITADTPDGEHTYEVTVTDDVGNTASVSRATVLDRTLPALAFVDGPSDGQAVVTPDVAMTFSQVEANPGTLTCTLDGSPVTPCGASSPVQLAGLVNGAHVFAVKATDAAGNTRTITRTFGVDLPKPTTPATPTTPTTPTTPVTPVAPPPPVTAGPGDTFAPRFIERTRSIGKLTKFKKLSIADLPAAAKVSVTCKGQGCTFKKKSLEHSGAKLNVLKKLKRLVLGPHATLKIIVRAADGAKSSVKYTMRSGKKPKVRLG